MRKTIRFIKILIPFILMCSVPVVAQPDPARSSTGIAYSRFDVLNLPFDAEMKKQLPSFYEKGTFDEQGVNQYGYTGTCAEASEASAMNTLFNTTVYTENALLNCAIRKQLCEITGTPEINGGQSPIQVEALMNAVGEYTGDMVEAKYAVGIDLPDPEETARLAEDPDSAIIMSVASNVLWDRPMEYAAALGINATDYYTCDHWILMGKATRDEKGEITGFEIVDSSGYGKDYVDINKYINMVYGPTGTEVRYQAAVIIKKKEINEDTITSWKRRMGLDTPPVKKNNWVFNTDKDREGFENDI